MIIKTEPYKNSAHANQSVTLQIIPDGWAVIPDNMELPATFPFINLTIDENGNITGVTAGVVSETGAGSNGTIRGRGRGGVACRSRIQADAFRTWNYLIKKGDK